jgi:glyceraldehyde 3-phosphate dehydrogenase
LLWCDGQAITGAAEVISKVVTSFAGKLTRIAFHVPVSDISVVDLILK